MHYICYINFVAVEPVITRLQLQERKEAGITAIKIERTRIHFLSDVFTLVANVGSVILPTKLVLTPVSEVSRIFTEENSDVCGGEGPGGSDPPFQT